MTTGTNFSIFTKNTQIKMNIIIVDNNRLLLRFLATYLRQKRHTVTTFEDPTKVLPWLKLNTIPEVAILDISMPKMDGFELTKLLTDTHPEIKTVIFSGLGDHEESIARAKACGAVGYVSKGLGPSEIYSAIMRATT